MAEDLPEKPHPPFAVGGILGGRFGFEIGGSEAVEGGERSVDSENGFGEPLAFRVTYFTLFDLLAALESLPSEVLLCLFDPLTIPGGNRLVALDLEDKVPQVDRITLDRNLLRYTQADGRPVPIDPFEELFPLVLFHGSRLYAVGPLKCTPTASAIKTRSPRPKSLCRPVSNRGVMAKCDQCGADENMPYTCGYCNGTFCGTHRLPENHECPGLTEWNDPDGVFDSGFDDSVRQPGGQSGTILDRVDLGGVGGPIAYFRGNLSYTFLALMWVTFMLQFIAQLVSPGLHQTLFVLSSEHPAHVWTWVTSIFSHGGFGHIVVNSIVLYFFGPIVERRVGAKNFLALFLVAGMAAGLAQISAAIALGGISRVVGASGAIMAVMGVLTVLNPHLRVYLYFILPVPLWLLTLGFAGYSVFIALGGGIGAGGVAHLAHLTGLVIGLGYGEKLKRAGERLPEQLRFGPGGGRGGMGGPGRRW